MKTKILTLMALFCVVAFTSCSKDEETFDYSMSTLYGTWEGSEIKSGDNWIDITSWIYSKYQFGIVFYDDGTYYGYGYFGTGSGTYKAIDNKIITYVDGVQYIVYTIKSLTNSTAELTMSMDGSDSTIDIRVEKE